MVPIVRGIIVITLFQCLACPSVMTIRPTGASRNTLERHFRDLIERNHLEQHGSGHRAWQGLK